MVNRMVFFYVYVIAERFTSDFGESLLPVLFSPTEPINTPMIHDLIQASQVESENKRKRSRHAPKAQQAHSPGPSARSLNACQLQVNTCACLNDLILEEQKRERLRRKLSLRHSLFSVCEINDFIPRILFLVESQVNIHGTCHRASYHGVVADTQEAHHLHVCGYR